MKLLNVMLAAGICFCACTDYSAKFEEEYIDTQASAPSDLILYDVVDYRDGKNYRTTTIGTQVWMAEDLKYTNEVGISAKCELNNCMYTWTIAVDSAGMFSDAAKKCGSSKVCDLSEKLVRGICPAGWHIPTQSEWQQLIDFVGGKEIALKELNAADYNNYDFSIIDEANKFWIANQESDNYAYFADFDSYISFSTKQIHSYLSVRCIYDTPATMPEQSENGKLFDVRDEREYKTVKIGSKEWMAENLNYKSNYDYKRCYDTNSDYCKKYGALYTWAEAMDSTGKGIGKGCGSGVFCSYGSAASISNKNNIEVRGICPEGWHLPNSNDMDELTMEMRTLNANLYSPWGWQGGAEAKEARLLYGSHYGFMALPAGYYQEGEYAGLGSNAYFWSSLEWDSNAFDAQTFVMSFDGTFDGSVKEKKNRYSVRCVRDESWLDPFYVKSEKITDIRDGKSYKVLSIGGQVWMAENLNYAVEGSYCYENAESNCSLYGRYYTSEAAKTACPSGWEIPSNEDWGTLFAAIGGTEAAGYKLKSTENWKNDKNGIDEYGFGVVPAGYRYSSGSFSERGESAYFLSSSETSTYTTPGIRFYYNSYSVAEQTGSEGSAYSVRCIKSTSTGEPSQSQINSWSP